MRTYIRISNNSIPLLGLAIAFVLLGNASVKANNKPKVSKDVEVEFVKCNNNIESGNSSYARECIANEDMEAVDQEMTHVIENWIEGHSYWRSDDLTATKAEESKQVEKLMNNNSDSISYSGKIEQVILFNAQDFIPKSEF